MPAMMKGWLDRVWSAGWAYDWKHDPEGSLLPPRPCTLLIPTGVSEKMESEWRCVEKLAYLYRQGVLGYCGVDPIEIHFMLDAAEYGQGHDKHLQTALEAGKNIFRTNKPKPVQTGHGHKSGTSRIHPGLIHISRRRHHFVTTSLPVCVTASNSG